MATKTIGQLTALGATPSLDDLLEIETSGGASKKVTVAELLEAIGPAGAGYYFDVIHFTVGNVGLPSQVDIQLKDSDGNNVVADYCLMFKLCGAGNGNNDASVNGTVSGYGTATVLIDTIGNMLMIRANPATGRAAILITNATAAESMTIRIGPALVSPLEGDYSDTLTFSHS